MNRLLVVLFFCCQPAHAAIIQYDFTSVVKYGDGNYNLTDEINGRLWFDDAAAMTSFYECFDCGDVEEGAEVRTISTATYDATGMGLWVQVNGTEYSFAGTELTIQNTAYRSFEREFWYLYAVGASGEARLLFDEDYPENDPLLDTTLAAPIWADWVHVDDPLFVMMDNPFEDLDYALGLELISFAPTPVPEPGTLMLFSAALLAFVGRWRRRPA